MSLVGEQEPLFRWRVGREITAEKFLIEFSYLLDVAPPPRDVQEEQGEEEEEEVRKEKW